MIIGYIGKPRSGKTTALARYVFSNMLRVKFNSFLDRIHFPKRFRFFTYSAIYSTEYMKGTIKIRHYDVGLFDPSERSLIILGEAGTYFNNRLSSKIPSWCTDFFALHGHYGCDIVWDSQTVDVDKKLRNRTALLYHVRKGNLFRSLSFARRIWYDVTVDNNSHDLVEGYSISAGLMKPIHYLLRVNQIIIRPLYYRVFDSYNKPLLMQKSADSFERWS